MSPSTQAFVGLLCVLFGVIFFHLKTPWINGKVEALREPIVAADRDGNTAEGLRLIGITKRWFWLNRGLNTIATSVCVIGVLLELTAILAMLGIR